MANSFGDLFSALLAKQGLSRRAFARAMKVSPHLPSMVARGERLPPLDQLVKWADRLELKESERDNFLTKGLAAHLPKEYVAWLETVIRKKN